MRATRLLLTLLLLGLLAGCSHSSSTGYVVPAPTGAETSISVDEAYVGTDYAFGLYPLRVPEGRQAKVTKVEVLGLPSTVKVRFNAVSYVTSPTPLTAMVGTPELKDPGRFVLRPATPLVVTGGAQGTEDYFLIATFRATATGSFRTAGVKVTFLDGKGHPVDLTYPYRVGLVVDHASGVDPRASAKA